MENDGRGDMMRRFGLDKKKVSICIPAYNNTEGIQRLLCSIKQQTFCDYEVIITDDSQGESIQTLVQKYKELSVRYVKNRYPLGAARNCNKAIKLAEGEFIKVMHHDDWFADRKALERFVALMDAQKDIKMVFSGTYQVAQNEYIARSIKDEDAQRLEESPTNLYLGNYIGAPSATIFRNEGNYFDEQLRWLVDLELYMRILKNHNHFSYTKEPLICIGISDRQETNSCIKDRRLVRYEYWYVMRKHRLFRSVRYIKKYFKVLILGRE